MYFNGDLLTRCGKTIGSFPMLHLTLVFEET